jgi:hypothetical protein
MTTQEYIGIFAQVATIVIATGVVYFALKVLKDTFNVPGHIKSNIRKEKRLLNSITTDIKNNPSHWTAIPYEMMSQKEPHLINDKKNMAILIAGDQVTIKMNLTAAHKYRESAGETIATSVKGKHAKAFIKKAEGLIDTRGKELSFIEDMLDKRL